jgi:hypothetical protein
MANRAVFLVFEQTYGLKYFSPYIVFFFNKYKKEFQKNITFTRSTLTTTYNAIKL